MDPNLKSGRIWPNLNLHVLLLWRGKPLRRPRVARSLRRAQGALRGARRCAAAHRPAPGRARFVARRRQRSLSTLESGRTTAHGQMVPSPFAHGGVRALSATLVAASPSPCSAQAPVPAELGLYATTHISEDRTASALVGLQRGVPATSAARPSEAWCRGFYFIFNRSLT